MYNAKMSKITLWTLTSLSFFSQGTGGSAAGGATTFLVSVRTSDCPLEGVWSSKEFCIFIRSIIDILIDQVPICHDLQGPNLLLQSMVAKVC